jgi:hypothetical protein
MDSDKVHGLFHQWGNVKSEDCEGIITIGIVEDKDGKIHEVSPHNIEFIPLINPNYRHILK